MVDSEILAEYYPDEPKRNSNVEEDNNNSQSGIEYNEKAERNNSRASDEINNGTMSLNSLLWRGRLIDKRGLLPITIDRRGSKVQRTCSYS